MQTHRLTEVGAKWPLLSQLDAYLRSCGYLPMGGLIVVATQVQAQQQRMTQEEKEQAKAGKTAAEIWPDNPAVELHLVGEGMDTERLKTLASNLQASNVHFHPRVTPAETADRFYGADELVLHFAARDMGERLAMGQASRAFCRASMGFHVAIDMTAAVTVATASARRDSTSTTASG